VWALTLLVFALASHAVLIVWLRRVIGSGPARTSVLVVVGLVLSVSLFGPRETFGYASFELSVVTLGAGLFVALLVGARAFARVRHRWVRRAAPRMPEKTDSKPKVAEETHGRREAFVRIAGGVSWVASTGVLAWGGARGRHDFELVELVAKIPGLPRVLDGYAIVQISDLHIGTFVGEEDLARGLDLVTRARPDLLVVTGDLVDFDASLAPMVASRIARVAPRDGIVGILGNHDYNADAYVVSRALASVGIDVLVNESRILRPGDGGGIMLVGLDDYSAPRNGGRGPDLARTLAKTPSDVPRILLAHQPRQFDEAAGTVALQLSGHTHGYQFDLAARVGRIARKYVAGRYEKSGSILWVNRGFGVTGPPSRVGVRPEITKILLATS
jgi:predicted MPP superfamily phosphohydrolase